MRTAIQPTRATDYPQWYQEVIIAADLAQVSPVRGCMIINPWGYAIWERIQRILDDEIKRKGHENIYCPLLIPLSHIEREAEHIDGFAKECAVVTHTKLKKGANGTGPCISARRATGHTPHLRNGNWSRLRATYSVTPRPTPIDESMGKHHAMGNAHENVSTDIRVFMARGTYCACKRRRST